MLPNPALPAASAVAADHPNDAAHRWLDGLLATFDWTGRPAPEWGDPAVSGAIQSRLKATDPEFQIEVLLACVERMAGYNQARMKEPGHPTHYAVGALLYGIAVSLYRRPLPYTEAQLCALLRRSKHLCGHGCDVTPPFDLALAYARRSGMSAELLAALRVFIDGLKGLASSQTKALISRANLVFIMDFRPLQGQGRCWSERVRAGLPALPDAERALWQGLILRMSINLLPSAPKTWQQAAAAFIRDLGPALVVERLGAWWPDPAAADCWPLTPAGSHLLKHFVWLLGCVPAAAAETERATSLVCRLSGLDWKPRECGQKVMIAAADYLTRFPPAVSWPALQRLHAWSGSAPDGDREGKIAAALHAYQAAYPELSA